MEDGLLSAEEIDALLQLSVESYGASDEEIDALMDELTGGKEVEKTKMAYNPIDRTEGIVRETKDSILAVYERGYKDGKADAEREIDHEKDYERGMIDLWYGMKKMWTYHVQKEVFNVESISDIFYGYTPSEALAKIRKWEEKKAGRDEIKVGDEVIRHWRYEKRNHDVEEGDDRPTIYLGEESGGFWECLDYNATAKKIRVTSYPKDQYRKTGRSFPQIAEVINQMQEAVNE